VKKTKVIHLVPDLGVGGTQKVVLDICSSADLSKYDVSIYTLNKDIELLSTYKLSPAITIKTYTYKYSNDYSLFSYFKHFFFTKNVKNNSERLTNDIIVEKPDILHLHIHPRELAIGIFIQQKTKCELVFTQHLLRLNPKSLSLTILGIIYRLVFRKYNIIAISKGTYDEILKHKLLGKNKKLTLIENKLNINLYQPKPKCKKEFTSVVYVARIDYPKGHEELILAWSKINLKYKKKLLLVGPDGLNNKIQELTKKIITDNSVIFMGTQHQIAEILDECDFAVFPSFQEGLPIALLEKMAMSLPVVVSDIPELTSIVKDNVNGIVFKCGDTDDLATKITILFENIELRTLLGDKARETIRNKYGSKNIALPNENFYEKVLFSKKD
jgi:glycosyltransferase involved in cell wall biosynthesis